MAVYKCRMCGGDLTLTPGETVTTCEYCGSVQTVPTADNEKKMTLFARANRLLRACEFDKAAGIYEAIVADFPEEAEAYWGLVLCKYGIEYVDDPATGKKVPTCHRSSFEAVQQDGNYEQALENTDAFGRRVYRDEGKAIEKLRQDIVEVSGKEEPYDIFICYKETDENGGRTLDSVLAQDIYDALQEKGYRVFFSRVTLEDKLGQLYEPYIFAALNSAKVMLAVGTDYEYYNAVWVKNEWSRFLKLMASGQKKTLIPCYKGIDAYDMPSEFARLQAQDMGKVGAMQDLLRGIEKILPKSGKAETPSVQPVQIVQTAAGVPGVEPLLRRGDLFLEDKNWDGATEYYNKVLDLAPECAEAYLGKALAAAQQSTREAYAKGFVAGEIEPNRDFERAEQFAGEELKAWAKNLRQEAAAAANRREEERKRQEEEKKRQMEAERKRRAEERKRRAEERKRQEEECRQHAKQNEARLAPIRKKLAQANVAIDAGRWHTVGLKADGTVVATKYTGNQVYYNGQCDVDRWTDIVSIAVRWDHTVGLKADGTVVAVGHSRDCQCIVYGWKDIVAIASGNRHTVGLKAEGTVIAVGENNRGQCDVSGWTDIVAIAAGGSHTVGLKADGTVVATRYKNDQKYYNGQCDVDDWTDIVAIAAGDDHTVGLKADGTVVAVGKNDCSQCDVGGWKDIVAIAAGSSHTVGLKADGTVVAAGFSSILQYKVSSWTDIVAIAAGMSHTVGLKADGSVVAVGNNERGQRNVGDWKLFDEIDAAVRAAQERKQAAQERKQAAEERRQRRKAELEQEKTALTAELANLKGLFSGRRRREIEARLAAIEAELRKLS